MSTTSTWSTPSTRSRSRVAFSDDPPPPKHPALPQIGPLHAELFQHIFDSGLESIARWYAHSADSDTPPTARDLSLMTLTFQRLISIVNVVDDVPLRMACTPRPSVFPRAETSAPRAAASPRPAQSPAADPWASLREEGSADPAPSSSLSLSPSTSLSIPSPTPASSTSSSSSSSSTPTTPTTPNTVAPAPFPYFTDPYGYPLDCSCDDDPEFGPFEPDESQLFDAEYQARMCIVRHRLPTDELVDLARRDPRAAIDFIRAADRAAYAAAQAAQAAYAAAQASTDASTESDCAAAAARDSAPPTRAMAHSP